MKNQNAQISVVLSFGLSLGLKYFYQADKNLYCSVEELECASDNFSERHIN